MCSTLVQSLYGIDEINILGKVVRLVSPSAVSELVTKPDAFYLSASVTTVNS